MDNPTQIPIFPLRDKPVFPGIPLKLKIGREISKNAIIASIKEHSQYVGVLLQKDDVQKEPLVTDLYTTGVLLKIDQAKENASGITLIAMGVCRMRVTNWIQSEPYLLADVEYPDETQIANQKTNVAYGEFIHTIKQFAKVFGASEFSIDMDAEPSILCDAIASNLQTSFESKQRLIEEMNVEARVRAVHAMLLNEVSLAEHRRAIEEALQNKFNKAQKEYAVREQIKALKKQLGDSSEEEDLDDLEKKLDAAGLPDEIYQDAKKEIGKLKRTHTASAEYSIIYNYIEYLIELPWTKTSPDNLDLSNAEKVLDTDHYGLEKVKKRVLEFLSVRKLRNDNKGPILCFVGPPGVGKTSLGKSIAAALGRKYIRISLGGVHDEAEIRGHRRTYVGSMPGKIMAAIKKAGTKNPLFILDEVDKIGHDYRGDPSDALLEVLDPEQNFAFTDNYLNHPFDLSQVMFICTANDLSTIQGPLRDRFEVIHLDGYIETEKLEIAKRHLIPKQVIEHGLQKSELVITDEAVRKLIQDYTHESGVRGLTKEIANIARSIAKKKAYEESLPATIQASELSDIVGVPKSIASVAETNNPPGICTGLTWSAGGGDILFIEAVLTPNTKSGVASSPTITGNLGGVIIESAKIALAWIMSHLSECGIPEKILDKKNIHLHFPEGAIPKDGPSAGIGILTALVSLLTNQPVPGSLAMTGEISLRGRVLPIGGLKQKLMAARSAGIREVIIPEINRKDIAEIPGEIKDHLKIHFVSTIDEALKIAFQRPIEVSDEAPTSTKARRNSSPKLSSSQL